MSAEIPPVRCCGGGGRTEPNFQMESRPARDGSPRSQAAKRAAADIEGHSEAAELGKPRRLSARAARNPPNFRANHNAAHALTAIGD
jgi:thioredoxin-like negative regulator of GroEL